MSDSDNRRVKLLCNFGGEFARQLGRLSFVGGKTRLVLVDRSVNYEGLRSKMSQLGAYSPSGVEIKFQLPNETLDSRLVSVECDDDVVAMMSEFGSSQRIPVYIFDAGAADSVHRETGSEAVAQTITDCPNSIHGEDVIPVDPEDFVDVEDDLISIPRDCQNLAIGQEFVDAQAFRDALVATAIAMKFELTIIRSDRARVTAKCAAAGCSWRIHASKLPDVETFQIKTLKGKRSCVRPERSSHQQANMKWILSCIMDRVQENINYKPKEIMTDIEQEYCVIIPYLKAHRAKERALELIFRIKIKEIVLNQSEVLGVDNALSDVLDLWRKKPLRGSPVHCNLFKKTGHIRRSCIKLSQTKCQLTNLKEKNFHYMLCKQNGHNRRTCQNKQVEQVWIS